MGENIMRDNWEITDTCKELEQRGADVVGMNCFRGPDRCLTVRRKNNRHFLTSMTPTAAEYRHPMGERFQPPWIRFIAIVMKFAILRRTL
jgi:methionine synthase I (cobalamin-dependent)